MSSLQDKLTLKPVSLPVVAGEGALADLRRAAAARFEALGLPSQKLERWKYTSLAPLAKDEFALDGTAGDLVDLPEIEGTVRLVFVNGRFDDSKSDPLPEGVSLLARGEAGLADDEDSAEASLTTLNTALAEDGLVLTVDAGVTLDQTLHLVHVTSGGVATNLRHVLRLGEGARATTVETWLSNDAGAYWANVVTDVNLAKSARLTQYKWQREAESAYHTARNRVSIAEGALYESLILSTGGRIQRQEYDVALEGETADCNLKGISLGRDEQHLDVTVTMDHRAPNAHSEQLFKSVLAKGARSVFQGLVKVARGAIGTDAHQKSANLLLDRSAEVDTKPELEIFADDVACSHGATVGELDAQKIFYLCQRGLREEAAKALLVEGFVAGMLDDLEDEAIAQYLRDGAVSAVARLTAEGKA